VGLRGDVGRIKEFHFENLEKGHNTLADQEFVQPTKKASEGREKDNVGAHKRERAVRIVRLGIRSKAC